jgi:hypothetical protein
MTDGDFILPAPKSFRQTDRIVATALVGARVPVISFAGAIGSTAPADSMHARTGRTPDQPDRDFSMKSNTLNVTLAGLAIGVAIAFPAVAAPETTR